VGIKFDKCRTILLILGGADGGGGCFSYPIRRRMLRRQQAIGPDPQSLDVLAGICCRFAEGGRLVYISCVSGLLHFCRRQSLTGSAKAQYRNNSSADEGWNAKDIFHATVDVTAVLGAGWCNGGVVGGWVKGTSGSHELRTQPRNAARLQQTLDCEIDRRDMCVGDVLVHAPGQVVRRRISVIKRTLW
jgi:hypothetical protein